MAKFGFPEKLSVSKIEFDFSKNDFLVQNLG